MFRPRVLLFAPFILLAFAAFIALGGAVVMALWNWLLPSLFGLPTVTFWQALGLLALSRILFGGVRLSGGRRHGTGGGWRGRWHGMPPEARDRLRARMRERFGGGEPAGVDWQ